MWSDDINPTLNLVGIIMHNNQTMWSDDIDPTLNNVRLFFRSYVATLFCCLGYFYLTFEKKKPLQSLRNSFLSDFLLMHRTYQLVGHAMHFLGRGNQFTRYSALEGDGLLSDSFGFLVEGAILYSPIIFSWGTFHFSHWMLQLGCFGQTLRMFFNQQAVNKGPVYFMIVVTDIYFGFYALRRQLELREVVNSSNQQNATSQEQKVNPRSMRRASFAIKKHMELGGGGNKTRQTLMILLGTVLWILQHTDPTVLSGE